MVHIRNGKGKFQTYWENINLFVYLYDERYREKDVIAISKMKEEKTVYI